MAFELWKILWADILPKCCNIHILQTFVEMMTCAHLHKISDLLPLLRLGIHTGGVMSTGVQQDHTLLWDFLWHRKNVVIGRPTVSCIAQTLLDDRVFTVTQATRDITDYITDSNQLLFTQ